MHCIMLFVLTSGVVASSTESRQPQQKIIGSVTLDPVSAHAIDRSHGQGQLRGAGTGSDGDKQSVEQKSGKRIIGEAAMHATVYKPDGEPRGSVILLAPWDGRERWWIDWLKFDWNKLVKQQWRVLEAVGKFVEETNGGYRQWYGYEDWDSELPIEAEVDEAVAFVHGLIQQEYRIVKDYRHIVVAGYSQGAVLALESGLRFPQPLGLVFSQRGILFDSRLDNTSKVAATNYVFTAGSADTTYHQPWVHHCCHHPHALGSPAFLRIYQGLDHFACSEEENTLLMKSIDVVMAKHPPQSTDALSDIGSWEDC